MASPFSNSHFRISHAAAHYKRSGPDASCLTGGFYESPTTGQTVSTSSPLNITWNTSCMNSTAAIDIYMYAASLNESTVQVWKSVDFAKGSYQADLNPQWWNNSASINLQLAIVGAGQPSFMATATMPAGPIFTATYNGTKPESSTTSDDGVTVVNNVPVHKGPSKGGIAAAVIFTLLSIVLLVGIYIRISRAKRAEKSKRFTEKVDKRMSTIAGDWKAVTPAGASAVIQSFRNSMAWTSWANKDSENIRPVSTVDGGQAGIGANGTEGTPQMSQLRTPRPSPLGDRVSRVSFSSDTRNARRSAVFVSHGQKPDDVIPPVPRLPHSNSSDYASSDGRVSPTQAEGPVEYTEDDITARLSEHEIDVLPALHMMQYADQASPSPIENEFAQTPTQRYVFPVAPNPVYNPSPRTPTSPPTSFPSMPSPPAHAATYPYMQMQQPMPATMMSPDEMLRAYAERRVASPPLAAQAFPPAFPLPLAAQQSPPSSFNFNGTGMRTLYAAPAPVVGAGVFRQNTLRRASDEINEKDVYGGTSN